MGNLEIENNNLKDTGALIARSRDCYSQKQSQSKRKQRMDESFDKYSQNYKEILAQSTGQSPEAATFFASQKACYLKYCLSDKIALRQILDYGCGIGLALGPLRKRYPNSEITGADPSRSCLEVAAREYEEENFSLLSIDELNTRKYEHKFDLIFVSCVFHHIHAAAHVSTLENLRSLCSPCGQIVVFEHNPVNPLTRKTVENCPFDKGVILISPKKMYDRMNAAGWKKIHHRYITFVPPGLKRLKSVESVLGWLPLGAQYLITATPN